MTKLRPNFRKSRKIRTNAYKCGIFQPHITGVFFGALQGVDVDYPQFFVVGPPGYPSTQFLFTLLLILILCTLDAGGSSNRLQRSMVCYLSLSQAPELNHWSARTSENEIPSACCEEDGTPPSLQLFICGFAHQLPCFGGSVGVGVPSSG